MYIHNYNVNFSPLVISSVRISESHHFFGVWFLLKLKSKMLGNNWHDHFLGPWSFRSLDFPSRKLGFSAIPRFWNICVAFPSLVEIQTSHIQHSHGHGTQALWCFFPISSTDLNFILVNIDYFVTLLFPIHLLLKFIVFQLPDKCRNSTIQLLENINNWWWEIVIITPKIDLKRLFFREFFRNFQRCSPDRLNRKLLMQP